MQRTPGWLKFAISGEFYARALSNAAQRGTGYVGPKLLGTIARAPRAQLMPGLSTQARSSLELPTNAPGRNQTLFDRLSVVPLHTEGPMTGKPGGPGDPRQRARFDNVLRRGGAVTSQPGTQHAIEQAFGPASSAEETRVGGPGTAIGGPSRMLVPGTITQVGRRPRPRAPAAALALKTSALLPAALGTGLPLIVGGALLANKPGMRSNINNLFANKGTTQEQDTSGELPTEAIQQADAIHQALRAHGLDPQTIRMGIDAPPGSGKTTLARALAQQTGIKHYGLDWLPGNALHSSIGLGRNMEKMPRAPHAGEVLEHYMLGRTYDPELFDAMVHIHRDPEIIKQQLRARGNSAYISDMMDLPKSLGVADLGFDTLGGNTIDIGNGIQMKMRPHEGWGDQLDQRLLQSGIDPTGMSRHSKLLSLYAGKRVTGAGWTPYLHNPFSGKEMVGIGAAVPLGIMAAKSLARHRV